MESIYSIVSLHLGLGHSVHSLELFSAARECLWLVNMQIANFYRGGCEIVNIFLQIFVIVIWHVQAMHFYNIKLGQNLSCIMLTA